jgi:hypothetical protein
MPRFQLGLLENLQERFRFWLVSEAPSSVFVCRNLVCIAYSVGSLAEEDRLHGEQTKRSWFPCRLPRFERVLREIEEQ